jgi:hypothetical protein
MAPVPLRLELPCGFALLAAMLRTTDFREALERGGEVISGGGLDGRRVPGIRGEINTIDAERATKCANIAQFSAELIDIGLEFAFSSRIHA